MSRKERVFLCRIKDDKLEVVKTWSAAPERLLGKKINDSRYRKHRLIAHILPVAEDFSYVTYREWWLSREGILVNHFTGEVVKTGISETYDKDQSRWLVRSQQRNTFVVCGPDLWWASSKTVVFSVYNAEDVSLRMKRTLDQLPTFGYATISDCGTWLAVASTNGDMKVLNTWTGESFLWPKADVRLCGCDFRESFVTERLKEMLKMNGGIVD